VKTLKLIGCFPILALVCCSAGTQVGGIDSQKPAVDAGGVLEQTSGAGDLMSEAVDGQPAYGLTATPLYTKALTEADISRIFGVTASQPVTKTVFENFLKNKVKVAPADATQTAKSFLSVASAAFIPDDQKRKDLAAEGLTDAQITDGLLPREYLTYLRVAHGGGRCVNAKAGSSTCPALVRDFQMSIITSENAVFNIRFASDKDSQYENTLTIHRESQANRQLFQYIGLGLGLDGNPLKKVVIDPAVPAMCSELESMLGSSPALENFLSQTVKVNPTVAQVTARQWGSRISEISNGVTYEYGFAPFLEGKLCSRINKGMCYSDDPKMTARLEQVVPGFLRKTSFNCHEIAKAVNVLTSMPAVEPLDFSKPLALPYDQTSLNLTADELFDFFIALGNALTNQPNATFADTLPQSDLDALNRSGIMNPENQMTSQTNLYFMNRFVGR
jgi:hypothetical protein